jgi:hypothetical protein
MTMTRQQQQKDRKHYHYHGTTGKDDDDEDTTVSITKGLKRQYDELYTKDWTYQEIFTEALIALKEKRREKRKA